MDKQIQRRRLVNVEYYQCVSRNQYDDKTYATPVSIPCFYSDKVEYAHTPNGVRIVAQRVLYFDTIMSVTEYDKFNVLGEDFTVIMVNTFAGIEPNTGTTVVYL